MTHIQVPLAELEVGDKLAHVVALKKILLRGSKEKPYLVITLSDRSGDFSAKKWKSSEDELKRYKSVKVALVTGSVDNYNGDKSIVLTSIAQLADEFSGDEMNILLGAPPPPGGTEEIPLEYDGLFEGTTKAKAGYETLIKNQKSVNQLTAGDDVDHILYCRAFQLRESKAGGSYYYDCSGTDHTKEILVRKFGANQSTKAPQEGVLCRIVGIVDDYQGNITIKAKEMYIITDATAEDKRNSWISSTFTIKELKIGLWNLIQQIKNQHIKKLCELFLQDPQYKEVFSLVPAATGNHHSHKSGLCEHLYTASSMAKDAAQLYNNLALNNLSLDLDAIVGGMFFHDAEKVSEYNVDGSYCSKGNILKHLERGIAYVAQKAASINCPEQVSNTLCHIISSHHGKLDWGSWDEMACPEAILIHHLDDWCSKLDPTIRELNNIADDQKFTDNYVKAIRGIAHRGTVSVDKPAYGEPRSIKLPDISDVEKILIAIKENLNNIKDKNLRSLCLNLLNKHEKSFLGGASKYQHYRLGLPEFTLRLMLFVEGMIYIWNKWVWPRNKIYMGIDLPVAGAFLLSLFKFREGNPILGDISYAYAEISVESGKIEGFDGELRDLLMHVVRSQINRDDNKFCAPEGIAVHYLYHLLSNLDKMMIDLGRGPLKDEPIQSRLLGRPIFSGMIIEG